MEVSIDGVGKNTIKHSVENSDLDDENSKESNLVTGSRICLVGSTATDENLVKAALAFGVEVVKSENGLEWLDSKSTVFVVDSFEGPVFESLRELKHRILGMTALKELAGRNEPLPPLHRPLYSLAMWGLVICFTGFRKKEEVMQLMQMIHSMGGRIRKDVDSKMSHLVAQRSGGVKYQYAMTFRVPVLSASWVREAWAMRPQCDYSATDANIINQHRLKPFQGLRVCFVGFPEEEQKHMAEVLVQNGGTHTDAEDMLCSHMVVDESTVTTVPSHAPQPPFIVKAEWFWASVQNEGCVDEKDYLFEDYLESLLSPSRRTTPVTVHTRKRRRLQEAVTRIAASPASHNRRSSVSDAGLLSVSGSFLDCTNSPSTHISDGGEAESVVAETQLDIKDLSARHKVFLELVQTEFNYVNTIQTIMNLYHKPLEAMLDTENELLNQLQLRTIFGLLPPIYDTHCEMLAELGKAAKCWTEDISVGEIILKFSKVLENVYPSYINFVENIKSMLHECDQAMPKFHAFLKIGQTKPECGRQSLFDLLIWPVQRLPRIELLLNDILKCTNKSNPDHSALIAAVAAIRKVNTHINEDKRRTEAQMEIFNIHNEIENCPAHLVSSHRRYITRCDLTELSDGLSGHGHALTFFLFNDVVEVCKRRSKAFNSLKSPNTTKLNASRQYKHIRLMPLSHIRHVIDITETEECHNVFALCCKNNQELKDKLYSFTITDDETDKMTFLRTLCRQMANMACRPDAENFLVSYDPDRLNIDTSDIGLGTLGKAMKFASRTRMKVGRAFSFNKTPSKLKRAMSTMMSPFGSTSNLTPSSQLAQMRLASCTNINELGTAPPPVASQYPTPMSVQPTRRNKHASLSVASLRRL